MKTTVFFFFAIVLSGCVTGDGAGARSPAERPAPASAIETVSLPVPVKTCRAENALFAVAVIELSDGSIVCQADDIRAQAGSYQADRCTGPDPCDCTATIENLSWDFYWNPAGAPAVECFPLDDPRLPCGCATRFSFAPEDCE